MIPNQKTTCFRNFALLYLFWLHITLKFCCASPNSSTICNHPGLEDVCPDEGSKTGQISVKRDNIFELSVLNQI